MAKGNSKEMLEFLFVGPLFSIFKRLNKIDRRLDEMATQAKIDALTQRVTAVGEKQSKALREVREEVRKLQEANPALDLTGLDSAVGNAESGAQDLDDVVPDVLPEPTEPTPEPEPEPEPEPTPETPTEPTPPAGDPTL